MKTETGFPPISNSKARILILGSMPGQKSLEKQEYYGHPQNSFWRIMGELCGFDYQIPYSERTNYLIDKRIALWDVLKSCIRPGSLDSSIKKDSMIVNDFDAFFQMHPSIEIIGFNGAKSFDVFKKYVLPSNEKYQSKVKLIPLPSTSPANARMTKDQKLLIWRQLLVK